MLIVMHTTTSDNAIIAIITAVFESGSGVSSTCHTGWQSVRAGPGRAVG